MRRGAAEIAEDIDGMFANSPYETLTQNEKDWMRAQINQIGEHQLLRQLRSVGAVLFALLFLTGNTMMQSIRERIPELAVLKTYGFSNAAVTSLVVRRVVAALSGRGRSRVGAGRDRVTGYLSAHGRGRHIVDRRASSSSGLRLRRWLR